MAAFDRGEALPEPKIASARWSDPIPAVLTGIRSALAVAITATFWFTTAWPNGPVAVGVAAVLVQRARFPRAAGQDQPGCCRNHSCRGDPGFRDPVLPDAACRRLSFDGRGARPADADLRFHNGAAAHRPARPHVCRVFFAFASNIDNVMTYDAAAFLNSSLAVLFGIAVAVVLFATFFPETPAFAVRRFRRQLSVHLGHLVDASRCASALSCYQRALFEQLGTTLARVKNEPGIARECSESALAALSAAQAVSRLKSSLDRITVVPKIGAEGSRLLSRLSQTLRNPSVWKFGRRAAEARALSRHALAIARNSAELGATEAPSVVVVGSATLVSDLMRARMVLQGKSHAIPI